MVISLALAVTLLGAAACGSSDGGGIDERGIADPTPKATVDPGRYREIEELCPVTDFSPVAAVVGELQKVPVEEKILGQDSGWNGSICHHEMGPGFAQNEVKMACSADYDVPAAVHTFEYQRSVGVKYAVGGVKDIPGIGDQAFQYNHEQDGRPWDAELYLTTRDSNLLCTLQLRIEGVPPRGKMRDAYAAIARIVSTTLSKLR
ncbi:hypothetical protein [Streptomyces sp. SID8352]|uniref:hypothetical protein n=1 Tax=Streptomyces sp. SID8352 TaxID=2690338 RepID=UPI00137000AA|nr:hypothetical protein [Streptomyces sp. SID8352]MYU24606.1 hypothetical protein [Streptomyces sp. SID8352]